MTTMQCCAMSHVGFVRERNEDSFATSGMQPGHADAWWQGELGSEGGWALVADGMGGHVAGDIASELAVECLRTVLPELTSSEQITAAIEATNLALHDAMQMKPRLAGMGTTIAGVKFDGLQVTAFNAGDSRIYLEHQGRLEMLSEDHVIHGNVLTKCLGGLAQPSSVQPHVREVEVASGSRLLLCTDGLTEVVSDAAIASLVKEAEPSRSVVEAALEAGGPDNVTVVVIRVP